MAGLHKLMGSSTFAAGLVCVGVYAVFSALGIPVSIELLATLLGAYGIKEGADKLAARRG